MRGLIDLAAAPAALALGAAACFGLALALTQFGLRHLSPRQGAAIGIPTTALLFWLFWLLSPLALDLGGWDARRGRDLPCPRPAVPGGGDAADLRGEPPDGTQRLRRPRQPRTAFRRDIGRACPRRGAGSAAGARHRHHPHRRCRALD